MEQKSTDILPKEERLKVLDLIAGSVEIEYCVKYHKALLSAESEIEMSTLLYRQVINQLLVEQKLREDLERELTHTKTLLEESEKEKERRGGLIEDAFFEGLSLDTPFKLEVWEEFKKENNIE